MKPAMIRPRQRERGDSDIAGLIFLALVGLFFYGLWTGGKALWREWTGYALTQVECHVDGREVYSGLTVGGVGGPRHLDQWEIGNQ